jgi:hypothetical protein
MVLQSSGPIKFSQIRAEFNPNGPNTLIKLSDYYTAATTNYTQNMIFIPSNNTEKISLNYFYSLSKSFIYPIIKVNNINKSWKIVNNYSRAYFIFDDTDNTNSIIVNSQIIVDSLAVGGGAGGTYNTSNLPNSTAGGGGGRVFYAPNQQINSGSYTIIIGTGGNINFNGNNTTTFGLTANGGTISTDFNTGGSSGNAIYPTSSIIYTGGNRGFNNNYGDIYKGGGAGAGGNGTSGDGGQGFILDITGTGNPIEFGTGGGGALDNPNPLTVPYTYYGNTGADRNIYGGGGHGYYYNRINLMAISPSAGYKGCFIYAFNKQ